MDNSDAYGALAGLAGIMLVFVLIILAVYIAFYVLYSLGVMKLAQGRGLTKAWMAWLPIFGIRSYLIGEIADDVNLKLKGKTTYFRWINFGASWAVTIFTSSSTYSWFSDLLSSSRYLDDPSDFIQYFSNFAGKSMWVNLLGWAFLALQVVLLYMITQDYNPSASVAYTVSSAILGFLFWNNFYLLLLFTLRNRMPISSQGGYHPTNGYPPGPGGSVPPNSGYNPYPGQNFGNTYNPYSNQPPQQPQQPPQQPQQPTQGGNYDPNAASPYNPQDMPPQPEAPEPPKPPEPPESI